MKESRRRAVLKTMVKTMLLAACGLTALPAPVGAAPPFSVLSPPEGAVAFEVESEGDGLILTARLPASGTGLGAQARLRHDVTRARHVWLPHLAPEPGFVIGDHALRSPVILLANRKIALAFIPELADVEAARRLGLRVWLDYDHPAQTITLAVGKYEVGGFHVGYQARKVDYAGQDIRLRVHVVKSGRREDLENPYGMAARWIWKTWGHPKPEDGGGQRALLTKYEDYVARWAFGPQGWEETVWQEFSIDGRQCGAPAFIVDVAQHPSVPMAERRWREPKSVWNQAWFSTQRVANGLLRHARQGGSAELEQRARLMTEVALAAPQTNGLFPSVYTAGGSGMYQRDKDTPGWDRAHWTNSDRRPPGVSAEACHLLDAAFTARLLLEWHELVGAGETEAVPYVRRFADRLCALQRPSGAFPGWVEPDGTVPPTLAEGPESAMGATLLLELTARFPQEKKYRTAAVRALHYLESGPVVQSRWEDFETYFSCSAWGREKIGQTVARNGVYKSNTLSPFWCAEAFLSAHRVLGDRHFLNLGRRCLDELSLFQQVWNPSWIPADCFGGFGVMNGDGEWNDARQSLFAPLYLAYYDATGVPEYFERGTAALRASFALLYCPENAQARAAYKRAHPFFGPESYGFMMENIAHGGPGENAIGPFTIFTWGNGAALASAAVIRDRYGDVYVDTARRAAFGIDGCEARVDGGQVRIHSRFARAAPLLVRYASGAQRMANLDGRGEATIPLKP